MQAASQVTAVWNLGPFSGVLQPGGGAGVASVCLSRLWKSHTSKYYLDCDPVLVHGQDLASGEGIQLWKEDAEGRPVSCEGLVRDEVVWHILCPQLHR